MMTRDDTMMLSCRLQNIQLQSTTAHAHIIPYFNLTHKFTKLVPGRLTDDLLLQACAARLQPRDRGAHVPSLLPQPHEEDGEGLALRRPPHLHACVHACVSMCTHGVGGWAGAGRPRRGRAREAGGVDLALRRPPHCTRACTRVCARRQGLMGAGGARARAGA